ncbi:MAG: ATP synthase F1 subunit delta [Actinomycetota bacterium]
MADEDRVVDGYASALLSVAEAEGAVDEVEDELFRFGRTLESSYELRDALIDPALPDERKKALLQDLLGERASPTTIHLLELVVAEGRARQLDVIAERVSELAAERRRMVVAEVRSAVDLSEEERRRLTEVLARATDKQIELKVIVDPEVIGGVVARVGDQVFDGTVRTRLEAARERLGSS